VLLILVVGVMLGTGGAPFGTAVPVLLAYLLLRGLIEIAFPTTLIVQAPSPYRLYIETLGKAGHTPPRPWVAYLANMLGWGLAIGLFGYVVGRLITS
jgi:hypothetical protein